MPITRRELLTDASMAAIAALLPDVKALTPQQRTAVLGGARGSISLSGVTGVKCDIDSLTQGWPGQVSYPAYLQAKVDQPIVNLGRAGYTMPMAQADYASRAGAQFVAGNAVVFDGGRNDADGGADQATMWSRTQTSCQLYKATGYKLLVATVTARTTDNSTKLGILAAHNASILSRYNLPVASGGLGADGFIDIAGIPEAGNPANSTYFVDGEHYTSALNFIIAEKVRIALGLPLSAGGSGPELIINGGFDVNLQGWTATHNGGGTDPAWDSTNGGSVKVTRSDALSYGIIRTSIPTTNGQSYSLISTLVSAGAGLQIGTTVGGSNIKNLNFGAAGTANTNFTAQGSTTYIQYTPGSGTFYLDHVSVK